MGAAVGRRSSCLTSAQSARDQSLMSAEYPIVASSHGPLTGAHAPRPATWAPEPPDETPEAGAPIARIIGAIMRYKWLTIALVIVGGVLGGIATRFVAPVYE